MAEATEKTCPKCREYMAFDKELNAWHCLFCGKYAFLNILTTKKCATPGCMKKVAGDYLYCTDCSVRMEFHRPQGGKKTVGASGTRPVFGSPGINAGECHSPLQENKP